MININEIFDNNQDVAKDVCLWLGNNSDSVELAGAAEYMVEMHIPMVSLKPEFVPIVWPWIEKSNIKIMARFDNLTVDNMSKLAVDVNSVFKQGADGAQLFLKLSELKRFADSVENVRDDLFFNKDLSVALDIFEIWPLDWADVFSALKKLRATSLLLIMTHDDMDKSDFTGRIYAALENWDSDASMSLHVMLDESYKRAEQVYRLVAINRPELLNKLKFFVSY